MLKSGLAPMASTEDLEEVVSLIPDRSQDEHESKIRNNTSIADTLASMKDGQDDRKDCFISALDVLKDLLKEERMYCIQDNIGEKVFEFLTNILKKLEVGIQNSSIALDQDLSTEENVTLLKELWDKMSPFDRMHARIVYFVVLSQLQRATLTMWEPEERLKPVVQAREIVQNLWVFIRTTRSYLRYILHLQRDADNCIWRLNHLDNYRKRVTKGRKIRSHLRTLFLHLVKLNNFLLSSSIEQMVAQRPSLKYYGQGRSSNPVHLSRENSKVGSQTLNNVDMSFRDIARHETMWLHLALKEMLLDHQEWADIVSSRLSSRNGDDSADMDTESIGSILKEALKTTSCLLGLGTDPGKMYQDDGDGMCSMFRIEHLDEEKFRDTDDLEIIRNINELVSLNHILLRLMWSLDKFTKLDYVWDSERECGAEEDQDINDSYFAYKCRHIFNEEDVKLPNETCLTPMDDISFADDAIGVDAAEVGDAGFRLRKMGDRVLSLKNTRMAYIYDKMEDPCAFEKRLTNAYGPGARSWGRRPLMPIDALLFGAERDALREMAFSRKENPVQNMDRVALFIADDEGSLDVDTASQHQDEVLQHAILSLRGSEMPRERFRARKIDIGLLMLLPVLYLLDVATDCRVAYQHFSQSRYLSFFLTMLFILGPMVAELIHNSLKKLPDGRETWKEVFSLQSLRLLPRAWRSVMYAIITRREFDKDLCEFYEELNRWRGVPFERLSEDPSRSEISSINAHYFAMMVENERELDQWRVHEALYESAPQLLLQLVIANMQLVNGETVGPFTIIGILVSLTYFSWTLHLHHYRQHYNGLENNFKVLDRAIDFFVHFLIVGCRSIAVSSVMALCPVWFLVVAFFYLPLRYIYFYCCSPDRREYRKLTTGNYQILWMVHSVFITPCRLNVWCINSYDDLFYHSETFALALYWPFLLDGGHPLADYRWIITATILILNFIVLPLLLKLNEVMIKPSPFCDKHDPFLLRRRFWKDLKAGKTAVERLFRRLTGA